MKKNFSYFLVAIADYLQTSDVWGNATGTGKRIDFWGIFFAQLNKPER